jgi:hypothetical protein
MKIVYVDSFRVRNVFGDMNFNLCHGFGASWYTPWFIPPGEVWIEKSAKSETSLFLQVDRFEKKYYDRIGNYWQARKKVAKIICKPTNKNFVIKTFKQDSWTVRIVKGKIVRRSLDQSFVAGGHGLVYPWYIPKSEIWLDDTIAPVERKYILLHEMLEYRLMKKGLSYNKAHKIACTEEKKARLRDGLTLYPQKNPIDPLPFYKTNGNGEKRILIVSGIHGDEPSGSYTIAKFLLETHKFPKMQLDFIPLVNPSGFKKGTRQNKEGKDINRWFFDRPKRGEPWEVAKLRRFARGIKKPYDLLISLHEDSERKEFYLYDTGNGRNSKLIQNIFREVRKEGIPLYNGVDDAELKNFAIGGYIPVDPQSEVPTLEEYLTCNGEIKSGVILETPGKLTLPEKIAFAAKIFKKILASV